MIKNAFHRTAVAVALMTFAGCGAGGSLPVVPDDCAFFARAEARTWFASAQSNQSDGSSQLEAIAEIVGDCLQNHCDGNSGGVCAVSCTACADALVTLAYE